MDAHDDRTTRPLIDRPSLLRIALFTVLIGAPVAWFARGWILEQHARSMPPSEPTRPAVQLVVTDIAGARSREALLANLATMRALLRGQPELASLYTACRADSPESWFLRFDGDAGDAAFLLWVRAEADGATGMHWPILGDADAALGLGTPQPLRSTGLEWREATARLHDAGFLALPVAGGDGGARAGSATIEGCIEGRYHLVVREGGAGHVQAFDAAAAALLRATAAPQPRVLARFAGTSAAR